MSIVDKFRQKLQMILTLDRPPSVIATSAALGVLIGISPYLGFHTYIAILFSGWFNLPIYPLMIGAYITNPFTIPFIYGLTTKFGIMILGLHESINFNWHDVTIHSILETGKVLLLPFFVGTHVAGLILSIFTYGFTYIVIKKYRTYRDNKYIIK